MTEFAIQPTPKPIDDDQTALHINAALSRVKLLAEIRVKSQFARAILSVDAEFSDDLEEALRTAGFVPSPNRCMRMRACATEDK